MTISSHSQRLAIAVAVGCLFAIFPFASRAAAGRELLTEAAVETGFCNHCPPPPPPQTPPTNPPPEREIEGACGLAIDSAGNIYVSDYYHRVIDIYGPLPAKPSPAEPAKYGSQISLPGANPAFGTNTLDAVCGLALDTAGHLYANEFHQAVKQLRPTEFTIDEGESTGVAVDPSTDRLYVDDRTHIAEYALPASPNDSPLQTFASDPDADYYGLAASGGRIYVADAADQTVKVFEAEPATSTTPPVYTIAGFNSLTDAALAIDPTNGHLLIVDNLQPLFEHPKSQVREFGSAAESYVSLGSLSGDPIFGQPSGIAVGADGNLLVTDGNDELANVFAYGPYLEGFAPLAPASSTSAAASAAVTPPAAPDLGPALQASGTTSPTKKNHRHHRRHRRRAGGRQ